MFRILGVLGVLCGFACDSAFAASPQLSSISPRGAQRGTEAIVTFQGARLGDAVEVIAYHPGIAVKKLEPVQDNSLKVTLAIAPDCRLGEHLFRVRTATGISDARTFWVGALPSVEEKEPNSEFDKPQAIPLNVTVHGTIAGDDVDYFAVECKKGQRLSVEVEGMRLASSFFDPYVAILDSKRFEIATGDDAANTGQDGGCSAIIPADGTYVVQIRESAYSGNGPYRLHVGHFPRPTGVIPAGGKPGDEVELRFVGDPSGELRQKIKLPATADPMFRVHAQTADGVHPAGFRFRLNDLPNTLESGANKDVATATAGVAPGAFNGVVASAGETDYFKFPAKKGQVFEVHAYARNIGSPLDPVLHVGVAGGAYIAGNDDTRGPDSHLRVTSPVDGELAVWIHDHLKKGGPDYFYRIEVTPIAAKTTTDLPRVDGNNVSNQTRQTIVVPKGNRYATLVAVNRTDWGGAAVLGFDQLPAGMSFRADHVDPGQGVVPVVFDAKPDAGTAGKLVDVRANPVDPKVQAASKVGQPVFYSIGLNNTPFHSIQTDRMAVAVADPAPYSIEVIEPKAPVVQNGSLNLRIVAKRADGFKGPITVVPLWTPPGMGIQGSATISENATEAVLSMNAAPNAAARKWKTALLASADAGKGTVWVSSQLFGIEIAPPFVTFAQDRTAVEQGASAQVFGKVTVNTPFDGEAVVKLLGLPAKATTPDLKLTKDSKDLTFPVATDKTTPAGKHRVFCQVIVNVNGEQVIHSVGGNELRVDVPLPPKVASTPKPTTPVATPQPTPTPAQPPKRLSRLEQLRLEQEEREKAAKDGKK